MSIYQIETERADLFDINMMIVMSVALSEKASREEIQQAFECAVHSNEILNMRVVIDHLGNAFYESTKTPKSNLFYSVLPLTELVKEQEKRRFQIEEGEFLRLIADDESTEGMQLHFFMHHLGGDGKSLCYFIESFLTALSGAALEYRKAEFLSVDKLPKDSRPSALMKLIPWYYNFLWKKEKRCFDFTDMKTAYTQFWKSNETITEYIIVDEKELAEKVSLCKREGIGFTSLYIAEYLSALSETQDIGLAVDGRTNQNKSMGNQATGISVKYRYHLDKSISENARIINKRMKVKLSNNRWKYWILHFMESFEPTLLDAVNMEFVGTFHSKASARLVKLLGYGNNSKDISITNLTKLDIPTEYGKYRITSFWFIPPIVSYGKNIVGMVSANNRLYITNRRYRS